MRCRRSQELGRLSAKWRRIYSFLAQADTIKILVKGLFDFLSMLDFRPRPFNIGIARKALQ